MNSTIEEGFAGIANSTGEHTLEVELVWKWPKYAGMYCRY